MTRKVFLSNIELDEAVGKYLDKINIEKRNEMVSTWNALGRRTTKAVYAEISSPFYNSSAMDGITLNSDKSLGASERKPLILKENEDYHVVDTGDPIPNDCNCVIMVEDTETISEGLLKIYKSAAPWQHVRVIGEDIVEGSLIVPSNHKIRPVDIGALVAGGINEVEVYSRPKISIIPTGTELVEPGSELKVGDIIEFNSRTFSAQVEEWGGIPHRCNIVADDYEKIKSEISKAVENSDVVLVNAGSSAGREDFTRGIIEELGELVFHGLAIKPGKPAILGIVKGKPVVGIPGYPVSAFFIMENIVKKIIMCFLNENEKSLVVEKAVLSRRVMSSLKHLEFVRMKLGYVDNKLVATPLTRGAGATMSLVRADGILKVPQEIEGIEAGEEIEVELLRDKRDIENTLVSIGSHDPILDILADEIHKDSEITLSSAHCGSMGGIMALKKGETHIAPIHLLDKESGEYNWTYIQKYLKEKDICLIKCVGRIQGIILPKGNPMNIKSIKDIYEKKAVFVNRQRGAGTRILFDFLLEKNGIDSKEIKGYEREELTHLSVAAAVKSGDVDCGMGVFSAAEMMELDFIPMCNEAYDLAIERNNLGNKLVKRLIQILKSTSFRETLENLGGYDYSRSGDIESLN